MPKSVLPKVVISAIALALVLLSAFKGIELNASIVALAIIAALPWLAPIIDTLEFPGGGTVTFREIKEKVDQQERLLDSQQRIINQLVVYSMSSYLFNMLSQLYHRSRDGSEYRFTGDEAAKRDLRYLRDHGYLEHFYFAQLSEGVNLAEQLKLTPVGNFFVELREDLQARQISQAVEGLS